MPGEGLREDWEGTREAGTRNTCSLRMALRLFPAIVPVLWFAKHPSLTYCMYTPTMPTSLSLSLARPPARSLRDRKRAYAKVIGRR